MGFSSITASLAALTEGLQVSAWGAAGALVPWDKRYALERVFAAYADRSLVMLLEELASKIGLDYCPAARYAEAT